MKFAEHLSAHITPEWRKQYVSYEEMKAMLYMAVEEAPSVETAEQDEVTKHIKNFEEKFFSYCDKELKKINVFYSEKLAEATRKFATLRSELSPLLDSAFRSPKAGKIVDMVTQRKRNLPARKLQELKLAFSEFYLSLILLQNYQNLNFTGFRKILKKHDKLLNVEVGAHYREEFVESSHFHTSTDISRLISEVETTVTQELESGDRQRAMKRLRVPPLGEKQTPWTTFKVGLFSGSFLVLLCGVVLSAAFYDTSGEDLKTAFQLYRGPLLVIEFIFLIGVNVYGWRSSGVNHVLIFELDPRNHLSEQDLMEVAAILGVVWTLSLLTFIYSNSLSIPPYLNPLALVVVMVCFLINPAKVFRYEARFWTLRVMWRCLTAPFYYVGFADFWLGDQFNSLVTVFIDLHHFICFYVSGQCSTPTALITKGIVNCLPAWMRFCQCLRRYRDSKEAFPHLVNAAKYSCTFFVVITSILNSMYQDNFVDAQHNPFLYAYIIAATTNSLYTFTWDVKMDWGLFDSNAGDNTFLREEIVYSSRAFYYFAIVEDFILRFAWAFTYSFTQKGWVSVDLMTSITAPFEVFRRFVWNFFRLENEHLNNCGKFRAVRDISVAPIDSSDHNQIIRMMDDTEGVINRQGKKKSHETKRKEAIREDRRPLLGSDQIAINVASLASTPIAQSLMPDKSSPQFSLIHH